MWGLQGTLPIIDTEKDPHGIAPSGDLSKPRLLLVGLLFWIFYQSERALASSKVKHPAKDMGF
jgi:hypothetical protein